MPTNRDPERVGLPVTLRGGHHRVWGLVIGLSCIALIVMIGRNFVEIWGVAPDAAVMVGGLLVLLLAGLGWSVRLLFAGTLVDAEGVTVKRMLRNERIAWPRIDGFDVIMQPTARLQQWQVRALVTGVGYRVVLSQPVYDVVASVSVTAKTYPSPPVEAPKVIDRGFRIMRAAHRSAVGRRA